MANVVAVYGTPKSTATARMRVIHRTDHPFGQAGKHDYLAIASRLHQGMHTSPAFKQKDAVFCWYVNQKNSALSSDRMIIVPLIVRSRRELSNLRDEGVTISGASSDRIIRMDHPPLLREGLMRISETQYSGGAIDERRSILMNHLRIVTILRNAPGYGIEGRRRRADFIRLAAVA